MDRNGFFTIFEALDQSLQSSCELEIRGGAAVLALGLRGRTTLDVDVLPSSRFVDTDLRRSCAAASGNEVRPSWMIATAPRTSGRSGSTMSFSASTSWTTPRPVHAGQAPCGELNENSRGDSSDSAKPQRGQE